MINLAGIVYFSKATDFEIEDLSDLAKRAGRNNKNLGVTGYLYYEKGTFLQYIEGEANIIQMLMKKIEEDPRHDVLKILKKENLSDRKFPTWDMQYLTRNMLMQMNMENLIMNQMEYIKKVDKVSNNTMVDSRLEEPVWRMVDLLSQYK